LVGRGQPTSQKPAMVWFGIEQQPSTSCEVRAERPNQQYD
jgi:hypothetical protein